MKTFLKLCFFMIILSKKCENQKNKLIKDYSSAKSLLKKYQKFDDPEELYLEFLRIKAVLQNPTLTHGNNDLKLIYLLKRIDNIIDDRNTGAWKKLSKFSRKLCSDVINEINEIAEKLILNKRIKYDKLPLQIMEENIALEAFPELDRINRSFQFPSKDSNISTENQVYFTESFELNEIGKCSQCDTLQNSMIGIVYKELASKLFMEENLKTNSDIVGFKIGRRSVNLLNNSKVRIKMTHTEIKRRGDVPVCVFWDFSDDSWSDYGCSVIESTKFHTICECDHLTNFAVLMDINGRETAGGCKNILTIICSVFSMISLVVTFVCLTQIKCLHNRRTTVTKNLCVSLFLVNLIVTFGLDRTEYTTVCRSISLLLLFSIASSFLWMLLQGYIVYQTIILVFAGIGEISKKVMYIIGYGLAMLWLSLALVVVGPQGFYDSDKNYFCWISSFNDKWKIFIFAGPSLFIILLNFIVFLLCLNAIFIKRKRTQRMLSNQCNDDANKSNEKASTRWLNGWISMMVLLGLTWITGLLYLHTTFYFMSYIFIILNGLQGCFIFLFEIVFNQKARNVIANKFKSSFELNEENRA